jgi:maleamate amidohydrolase
VSTQPIDPAIYRQQSFGGKLGWGVAPALLIIDLQQAFIDPAVLGGEAVGSAIAQTERLLGAARASGIPIAHVRYVVQQDGSDLGPFGRKVPALARMHDASPLADFVPTLRPVAGELSFTKRHASAFFGTHLAAWLASHRIDSLLVAGCTTSGCVRASVVDANAHGFAPLVVAECVGDRSDESHRVSLFEMEQKYADVITLGEAGDYVARLAAARRG